jgi:hypothetical protein
MSTSGILPHLHPPVLWIQVLHLQQCEPPWPPGGLPQQGRGQPLGGHLLVQLAACTACQVHWWVTSQARNMCFLEQQMFDDEDVCDGSCQYVLEEDARRMAAVSAAPLCSCPRCKFPKCKRVLSLQHWGSVQLLGRCSASSAVPGYLSFTHVG